MKPISRLTSCCFALLLAASSVRAAITVTGYAFGAEGAALGSATIENFEDTALLGGLTIRMAGTSIGVPRVWTGTLPVVWNPLAASGASGLGGPFANNTWDGTYALCNGGFGTGLLGTHNGNFWDFQFADTVAFQFAAPKAMVGVGLSNFQSIGFTTPITQHRLIVNGQPWGLVESLPGWVGGIYTRNRYVVVSATAPDAITSVSFADVSATDGLVFDKLAVVDVQAPARPSTWGRIKALYR